NGWENSCKRERPRTAFKRDAWPCKNSRTVTSTSAGWSAEAKPALDFRHRGRIPAAQAGSSSLTLARNWLGKDGHQLDFEDQRRARRDLGWITAGSVSEFERNDEQSFLADLHHLDPFLPPIDDEVATQAENERLFTIPV